MVEHSVHLFPVYDELILAFRLEGDLITRHNSLTLKITIGISHYTYQRLLTYWLKDG